MACCKKEIDDNSINGTPECEYDNSDDTPIQRSPLQQAVAANPIIDSEAHSTTANICNVKIEESEIANGCIAEEVLHYDHTYTSNDQWPYITNTQLVNGGTVSNSQQSNCPIKVYPQYSNACMKEEMTEVTGTCVKTTTVHNTSIAYGNDHEKQHTSKTTRCVKCNCTMINKEVSVSHCIRCIRTYNSILMPFIKTFRGTVSAKNTLKLIECVRSNPCLYDNKDHYKSTQFKTMIWTTIASQSEMPHGIAAENEWIRLRDEFITGLRCSHQSKYYKQLKFLLPFIPKPANVSVAEEQAPKITEGASNAPEETLDVPSAATESSPPKKKPRLSSQKEKPRNREEVPTQQRVAPIDYPSSSTHNPLDTFFLSMCETTKNLPPYVQLQVKKKIFQAVIEAEEIVAAMHNDQEKNDMLQASTSYSEFPNPASPYSVHSTNEEEPDLWNES